MRIAITGATGFLGRYRLSPRGLRPSAAMLVSAKQTTGAASTPSTTRSTGCKVASVTAAAGAS